MATLTIPKDVIEGKPSLPAGIVDLRLDGFKPQFSKEKTSYNLRPVLRLVGSQDEDGKERQIWFNMNTNFKPCLVDICHALGQTLVKNPDGTYSIPGKFDGPDEDPSKWVYTGPLLGEVGKAELVEIPSQDDPTKMRNDILQFFCRVPGCTEKHSNNLIGKR